MRMENKSIIQSVLFRKSHWDVNSIFLWLVNHNYKLKKTNDSNKKQSAKATRLADDDCPYFR